MSLLLLIFVPLTEEKTTCGRSSTGKERWSSHATGDEDDGSPSDVDDSYSLDSGRSGAWTILNLRAVKRLKEEVRKRKKHWIVCGTCGWLVGDANMEGRRRPQGQG